MKPDFKIAFFVCFSKFVHEDAPKYANQFVVQMEKLI